MTDIEITNNNKKVNIVDIAKKLNIDKYIETYGKYKAKIDFTKINKKNKAKLVLVTAMSPTPYGEGKTTISIGIADALNKLNENPILVLREPSLGPVFGMKGGATGGGYSQVVPNNDINLHFTGDFHAITSANNLLCSAIDNHLYFGNSLNIDPESINFNRCIDVNDRALRDIEIGLSSNKEIKRKEKFQITAASEIMTIVCLSTGYKDLKRRLDNIIIGLNKDGNPIYAKELNVTGAMLVLLKDALKPNLVQTLEHTPTIIHGGPFANIAHGCNSIIATSTAMKLGDYVITEAGFGSDLGAEKFLDIKCRISNLKPDVIVIVATLKSLKYNAGITKEEIYNENIDAVKVGIDNLNIHIENMKKYNIPVVVCLNKYDKDSNNEVKVVNNFCTDKEIPFAISTSYRDGGMGSIELAQIIKKESEKDSTFKYLYSTDLSITEKINIIAREIYRSSNVEYSKEALDKVEKLNKLGLDKLPICIAKTQYSISDDPKKLNAPINNIIHVKNVNIYNGAGFITIMLGDIITMPGLSKEPGYEKINLDEDDNIIGII